MTRLISFSRSLLFYPTFDTFPRYTITGQVVLVLLRKIPFWMNMVARYLDIAIL